MIKEEAGKSKTMQWKKKRKKSFLVTGFWMAPSELRSCHKIFPRGAGGGGERRTMCDCGPLKHATFLMDLNNRPLWDFYTVLFDTERCDFSTEMIHSRHEGQAVSLAVNLKKKKQGYGSVWC